MGGARGGTFDGGGTKSWTQIPTRLGGTFDGGGPNPNGPPPRRVNFHATQGKGGCYRVNKTFFGRYMVLKGFKKFFVVVDGVIS